MTLTSCLRSTLLAALAALTLAWAMPAPAQTGDDAIVQAREALRRGDKSRLLMLRDITTLERHALAQWVDYWDLTNRLAEMRQSDLDAFYARWPATYVEDRLRNDWLLELGKRRDWDNLRREFPRFRMNDDREVTCYALLTRYLDGENVRREALAAWLDQRDKDDGCQLLATTLAGAGRLAPADIWLKVRSALEAGRHGAARAAAAVLNAEAEKSVAQLIDNPARFLARQASGAAGTPAELALLALLRMAANDPEAAATQLQTWQRRLPKPFAAWAWAGTGRQAALRLLPQAAEFYQRAWALLPAAADASAWPGDTLAWAVRSSLRSPLPAEQRWTLVRQAVDAMSVADQDDPAWVYWRARARSALAPAGTEGDGERAGANAALESITARMDFYGKLATEDLGRKIALPPVPEPLTDAERQGVRQTPGFQRSLQMFALGLRSEAVREWNFTLRDLVSDRQLLAAAQWACEREVWDRCINTSDRTRAEVDMTQRFPMPFRKDVVAQANDIGLDPAYVYGLIRQESRFIMDARSHVGASGLMQLMPATARWTARKIGLPFTQSMITDRDVNLKLGTSYLKLALDDFQGSQALAAAAYNAGPGRPRRWREGATVEAAAWAENIPFNETRDYVKKVLSNATYYSALITGQVGSLKARLGPAIGPKPTGAPDDNRDLP